MSKGHQPEQGQSWSFVCHLNYGGTGSVSIIKHDGKQTKTHVMKSDSGSGLATPRKPIFLGSADNGDAILLNPESKQIKLQHDLPCDAIPAYAYRDSANNRIWFMNDGDPETGNDTLNCGDMGASVTVIENDTGSGSGDIPAKVLKTICVGRGHHVTTFTSPSAKAPKTPHRAFVSNLIDGTISVIGNDASESSTFLKVIDTINLCETGKEENGEMRIPNNSFPHGMGYSPVTGKLYNLNNGYQTIAVINPVTNTIEDTIELKSSSNLLLSPDGRFLIGKGVDRKSDQNHIIGKISVVDAGKMTVSRVIDLPDVYPSTYRFNADGTKLYISTAATGKGTQKENIKLNTVLLFDTSKLPEIRLIKEIRAGMADCGRRPIAFLEKGGKTKLVFVPNPTDGTVSILDGENETVLDTVKVGDGSIADFSFSFWGGKITGC